MRNQTPVIQESNKAELATQKLRLLIGSREPGSKIPSERDLGVEWGIARMTARKAIEALADEGLLERRMGAGTFVSQMPDARAAGLSSFTAEMHRKGLTPSSRVLAFGREAADPVTAHRLQLEPGSEVVRFTRLRLADDTPIAIETTWMPAGLVEGMEAADLSGSLFEVLATKFNIHPGQALSTIDSAKSDTATSAALGLDQHEPCLRIQMDYLDKNRRPIMAATCHYRGDQYQLQVVLTRSAFASRTAKSRVR